MEVVFVLAILAGGVVVVWHLLSTVGLHGMLKIQEKGQIELAEAEVSFDTAVLSVRSLSGERRLHWCTDENNPRRWDEARIRGNFAYVFHSDNPASSVRIYSGEKGKSWLCGYCNGTLTGHAVAEVRRVVILKTPPAGARDVKVPLQHGFAYDVMGTLQCSNCGYKWTK